MVPAAMTKFELIRLCIECKSEQLVTETDAEDWFLPIKIFRLSIDF
jgi:hypothetical protein